MALTLNSATSAYGTSAKQKLSNPVIAGGPEDQLKTPLDGYFAAMAELIGYPAGKMLGWSGAGTALQTAKRMPRFCRR